MATEKKTPSRNALCSCGSGRKHKNCCAINPAGNPQQSNLTTQDLAEAYKLEQSGRTQQALATYEGLLKKFTHPGLLWGRGRCLAQLGQREAATTALIQAAQAYAGNEQMMTDVSSRLILLGKPEAALGVSRSGLEAFPNNIQLRINQADALRLLSRHEEAIGLLRDVSLLAPERLGVSASLVHSLRNSGQVELALETAEAALARHTKRSQEYASLLNEVAHCQQLLGNYDAAFAAATRSGAIALETPQAQAADGDAILRRIKQYRSWIAHHGLPPGKAPRGLQDKTLVFIVGFPRSGTTLLESLLAAHPAVRTSGEAPLLAAPVATLLPVDAAPGKLLEILAGAGQEDLDKARASYFARVRSEYGDDFEVFVDKLPLNIIELVLIKTLFPEAAVVLCLRDPRDVCLSCLFQWFGVRDAMKPFLNWETTVEYYAGIMDYWHSLAPLLLDAVYVNRYEDLIADVPTQLRALARHIELPWDDEMLNFKRENSGKYFHTPSNEAIRSTINNKAVARWRHYSEHIAKVESVLRPPLERLGYRW